MVWCAEPGCGVLVQWGRCSEHARTIDRARGTARARGYSKRWDRRAAVFKRLYPLCGMRPNGLRAIGSRCQEEGRTTIAELVDHVIPHRGNPTLMWDERNWQSLCRACHSAKTAAGL
jgi:5-methylcytosine-specific restriction enzyme A